MIKLYNGDCLDIMRCGDFQMAIRGKTPIIVTDPPFNIGYHYNTYKDKMNDKQYLEWLKEIIHDKAFVLIHYPEQLYKIFAFIGESPSRVVSWVYNSNTARQHRDIAFGGGRDLISI